MDIVTNNLKFVAEIKDVLVVKGNVADAVINNL
jgi:hypothetical protein